MSAAPESFDRIPPHNIDAEMALLGACLVDREIAAEIVPSLRAEAFYAHVHETLWATFDGIVRADRPLDKITVAEELRQRGALERVGGLGYLNKLLDEVQTSASARYYATIVREKWQCRSVIRIGSEIMQLGFDGQEDVSSAIGQAMKKTEALVTDAAPRTGSSMAQAIARYRARLASPGGLIYLTPWPMLNRLVAGFRPGELIVLAGESKLGKSMWSNMLMVYLAERYALFGKPAGSIALFPPDMGQDPTTARLIALYSGISARLQGEDELLRRGETLEGARLLTDFERERVSEAEKRLEVLPIRIFDDTVSIEDVVAQSRRLHREAPLKLVVVDTIGALADLQKSGRESKTEKLERIAWALKHLARELETPVLVLHHLNQKEKAGTRPNASRLRDGGNLDGIASTVLFLHKEEGKNRWDDRYYLVVERTREGSSGDIPVRFIGQRALYLEGHDKNDAGYQPRAWCEDLDSVQSSFDGLGSPDAFDPEAALI